MRKLLPSALLLLHSAAFAAVDTKHFAGPWFTGPLLSPTAEVTALGSYQVQPYIFWLVYNSYYDKHWHRHSVPNFYQTTFVLPVWFGIQHKTDINVNFQAQYNKTEGVSSGGFGDLPISIDYQIFEGRPEYIYMPAIKISLTETFPTGKFDRLDPKKLLTDGTGWGSYSTGISLTFAKVIHLWENHYFFPRLNFTDTIFAPMHVKGYSVYGGDPSTRGKIFPGNLFQVFIGLELSLTEHWALATDITGSFYQKDTFKGTTQEPVGFLPVTLLSAAPAIEYNWNNHLGLIVGSWFTFAGKNDNGFAGAVASATFFYAF